MLIINIYLYTIVRRARLGSWKIEGLPPDHLELYDAQGLDVDAIRVEIAVRGSRTIRDARVRPFPENGYALPPVREEWTGVGNAIIATVAKKVKSVRLRRGPLRHFYQRPGAVPVS